MNLNRMLFRLYAIPVLLIVGSLITMYIFGSVIPDSFSNTALAGLGDSAKGFAPKAGLFLIVISLAWSLVSSISLWKWYQGSSSIDYCHNCGGMTNYRQGIRGRSNYHKCMACGANRADR